MVRFIEVLLPTRGTVRIREVSKSGKTAVLYLDAAKTRVFTAEDYETIKRKLIPVEEDLHTGPGGERSPGRRD